MSMLGIGSSGCHRVRQKLLKKDPRLTEREIAKLASLKGQFLAGAWTPSDP